MICAWIQTDEEDVGSPSPEPETQINSFSRPNQNEKKNGNRKGGYFKKRKAKFKKNNQFRTVTVISHYDENDELLDEVIEDEGNVDEGNPEIQSLDLSDIMENNFSLGMLNCNDQIEEDIFVGLENETNSIVMFSDESDLNTVLELEEFDEIDQSSEERTQISETDCDKLEHYL